MSNNSHRSPKKPNFKKAKRTLQHSKEKLNRSTSGIRRAQFWKETKCKLATAAKKMIFLLPSAKSLPNVTVRWLTCSPIRWAEARGHPGLKAWKDLCNYLTRLILDTKSVNTRPPRRVPSHIRSFVRMARSGERETVTALSLLSLYRIIKLPPQVDIGTIVAPFKGNLSRLVGDYHFLEQASQAFQEKHRISLLRERDLEWHLSSAAGPSGPVAWSRFLEDFSAVKDSKLRYFLYLLFKALPIANGYEVSRLWGEASSGYYSVAPVKWKYSYSNFQKFKYLWKVKSQVFTYYTGVAKWLIKRFLGNDSKSYPHSRLAFLSDKGGKTRVVAIGDIFTQSLLKPVHSHIFSILKRIPEDGTFDQDTQRRRVCEATLLHQEIHSVDMSACTDRLPALYQALSLYLCGAMTLGQAISWLLVCTKRDFLVKQHKGRPFKVRYAVGQPMGFLSSWAVMALSHHLLVAWASWKAKRTLTSSYAILGDDVVIWDRDVALSYRELLASLGVDTNSSKSFAEVGLAEFAKAFYKKGKDLKPLSPDLFLWSNLEGPAKMVAIAENLKEKSFRPVWNFFRNAFPRIPSQKLATLLSIKGCGYVCGVDWKPTPIHEMFLIAHRFNRRVTTSLREYFRAVVDIRDQVLGREWAVLPRNTATPSSSVIQHNDLVLDSIYKVTRVDNPSPLLIVGPEWFCWDPDYWGHKAYHPAPPWDKDVTVHVLDHSTIARRRNPPLVYGKEWTSLIRLGKPYYYYNVYGYREFFLWH